MTDRELITEAIEARKNAYSPYSHFQVGAALLGESGTVYRGCNIENAVYNANCAERTALFKAVSEGERRFRKIAIVGGPEGGPLSNTPPCGICRQILREFCDPMSFEVLLAVSPDQFRRFTLHQLLPEDFGPDNLNKS